MKVTRREALKLLAAGFTVSATGIGAGEVLASLSKTPVALGTVMPGVEIDYVNKTLIFTGDSLYIRMDDLYYYLKKHWEDRDDPMPILVSENSYMFHDYTLQIGKPGEPANVTLGHPYTPEKWTMSSETEELIRDGGWGEEK